MPTEHGRPPGTPLRRLLTAIGEPLIELHAGAAELDRPVRGVAIVDPDDEPGSYPDELVLLIGARGKQAARMLRAAARRGATAGAVKVDDAGSTGELRAAAAEAEIALLAVRPQARWDQLAALARQVLDGVVASALADGERAGDLFSLAETVATLAGGSVSIEDPASRVLAYSRSDDEVDELRRLSILGWEGPQAYLALLRDWGVYHRLRTSEEVVRIDERPDLGIRRRLAIGIRAGTQHLGTIWVQEGREPFAERAESALVGAARMAAVQLLRHRSESSVRSRHDLVAELLDGSVSPDLVAGNVGIDPSSPAVVVAFAADPAGSDRPAHELGRAELAGVVSVHATSYRRDALVAALDDRVYAVLPGVPAVDTSLTGFAEDVVSVVRRRTGAGVRAAIGSPVRALGETPASRSEADRVLDVLGHDPATAVATMADLRSEVLLGETLSLLAANPELRDPGVDTLLAHDDAHGTELVTSLLTYLDALGDVRSAAGSLHIHPNTLRHRVKRAGAVGGIDLNDPRQRLFCHLQLLLAVRTRERR